MKNINHSNSIHTFKVKRKKNKSKIIQYTIVIVFLSFILGFLYEVISNNKIVTANKTKTSRMITINEAKINYNIQGDGIFTVVLESDLGITSQEWNKVLKEAPKDMQLFYYDRPGLGKSESTKSEITPENQAKELHTILNKAGLKGPYILVGSRYASLINQEFINLYGDDVAGAIFIDGYTKEYVESSNFAKKNNSEILKLKIEKTLSSIGITRLLDKFNLIKYPENLLSGFYENDKELYKNYRVRKSFCETFALEREAIKEGKSPAIKENILENKPVLILDSGNDEELSNQQQELLKLSNKSDISSIENVDSFIELTKPQSIINAIKSVSKKIPKNIK